MRYEKVEHPEHLLFLDRVTQEYRVLRPGPDGRPQLKKVKFVPKKPEVLLLPPPRTEPVLQIPRYSEMVRSGQIREKKEGETETVGPDFFDRHIFSKWDAIPLPFRIAFCVIAFLSVCTVPTVVTHPKVIQNIVQSIVPAVAPSNKYTDRLTRISQLDRDQYNSGQFDAYSPSACSAASMAEALNSYGSNYKIGDILSAEISLGVITPSEGLTSTSGIAQTLGRFGFEAHPISGLDQMIETANSGTPVIADLLPGAAWSGGHFLVIRGGDENNVILADSWSTNYTQVDRQRFLRWNLGQGWAVVPGEYTILRDPTLSADQVNAILSANGSPAAGEGQDIYLMSQQYHLDDAYILATFWHESSYGKLGVARESKSVGNLRCADWIKLGWCQGGYSYFHNYRDGLETLYQLLSGSHYTGAGLTTPETIIPVYAPTSDNNDEAAYIAALKHAIDAFRKGQTTL